MTEALTQDAIVNDLLERVMKEYEVVLDDEPADNPEPEEDEKETPEEKTDEDVEENPAIKPLISKFIWTGATAGITAIVEEMITGYLVDEYPDVFRPEGKAAAAPLWAFPAVKIVASLAGYHFGNKARGTTAKYLWYGFATGSAVSALLDVKDLIEEVYIESQGGADNVSSIGDTVVAITGA